MRLTAPSPAILASLVAAGAVGALLAITLRDDVQAPAQATAPVIAAPAMAALPASESPQRLPSLAPMLQRVTPAVVSVHARQRVRLNNPFANDPVFGRMFPNVPQERINQSLGSGVIVDAARGFVLTNHHVIEGADEVSVTLADGRTLKADFIGSDADTDVALMRIPTGAPGTTDTGLVALPLADSGKLQVGDFVVAVGNPFGVGQTVTSGIVSAVGRSNVPGVGFQNFIQTDASINPGNSGGALVNLRGELVGINTASFNPQGSMAGNIGLGFAIPANLASGVMAQLAATGEVKRGTLGIDTQDIDETLQQALELPTTRGALVTAVHAGSAGAAAGLQPRDVIVAANAERIDDSEALRNFQGLQPADARVVLDVLRDGKPLQLSSGLRERPRTLAGIDIHPRLAGAVFTELPEAVRRTGVAGVLVESVAPDSAAARSGLRSKDVVLGANSGPFTDLSGFRSSLSRQSPNVLLRILRGAAQGNLLLQ